MDIKVKDAATTLDITFQRKPTKVTLHADGHITAKNRELLWVLSKDLKPQFLYSPNQDDQVNSWSVTFREHEGQQFYAVRDGAHHEPEKLLTDTHPYKLGYEQLVRAIGAVGKTKLPPELHARIGKAGYLARS